MIIGKREASIAESVCIKASAMVLFLLFEIAWGLPYMKLISMGVFTYHKRVGLILSILAFGLVYFPLKKKYLGRVDQVVIEYDKRFNFKNWQIVSLFILFWFGSLLLFWGSLLYFRNTWYKV